MQLLEDINYQRTKEMRNLMKDGKKNDIFKLSTKLLIFPKPQPSFFCVYPQIQDSLYCKEIHNGLKFSLDISYSKIIKKQQLTLMISYFSLERSILRKAAAANPSMRMKLRCSVKTRKSFLVRIQLNNFNQEIMHSTNFPNLQLETRMLIGRKLCTLIV